LDRGRVVAAGSPGSLRGAGDDDLQLELTLHPDGSDPSDPPSTVPIPIIRRVRAGRRVLLTLTGADAAAAVAWATDLRASDHVEGYALAPAPLEDAYLAATASADAHTTE